MRRRRKHIKSNEIESRLFKTMQPVLGSEPNAKWAVLDLAVAQIRARDVEIADLKFQLTTVRRELTADLRALASRVAKGQ